MSLQGELKTVAIKLKITQCDRWPIFTPRWTKHFEFGHVIANITITLISLKISRYYRSSNSKHCSSNRDFEFEHFSEIISILVISKKIYLISLKLQPKHGVIKMKITQWNIWHIFSLHCTKHFIFGHFIAIVAITVISLKIYKILQKL